MPKGKPISSEIKDFVVERYDQLILEHSTRKCYEQIVEEIRDEFDLKISSCAVGNIILSCLPDGTHLHEFFDRMISDFKSKYGRTANKRYPSRLLNNITYFIEREYGFSGKLKNHERHILSNALYKRGDIVFVDDSSYQNSGKKRVKFGYFTN